MLQIFCSTAKRIAYGYVTLWAMRENFMWSRNIIMGRRLMDDATVVSEKAKDYFDQGFN